MKKFTIIAILLTLAGCSSPEQRMTECESKGISKDTCYLAEQNRQATARAAILGASESAALQHAQAAKYKPGTMQPIHVKKFDIDFKRSRDGFAWINEKLAANDENTADASTYSAGLYTVIVYKNGRIVAMKDGQFLGRMK